MANIQKNEGVAISVNKGVQEQGKFIEIIRTKNNIVKKFKLYSKSTSLSIVLTDKIGVNEFLLINTLTEEKIALPLKYLTVFFDDAFIVYNSNKKIQNDTLKTSTQTSSPQTFKVA
jgi:hypothetical protein